MKLATESNFTDPDAAYRMIATAHRDLTAEESAALDAALILLLANHIGDAVVLEQALAAARAVACG